MNDESTSLPERKKQLLEVTIFLFLILPSMLFSFFVVQQGQVGFHLAAASTILRDLGLVLLILYIVWDDKEPFSHIGLPGRVHIAEIGLGVLLYIPFFFITSWISSFLVTHGFSAPQSMPSTVTIHHSAASIILATVLVIVVAFCEEVIFRGYLIHRFHTITANFIWSIVLSSFIFAIGHGYEGSAGMVTVGIMGAIFAVIYLWRGNLLAVMTMHFLQDFISIVLISFIS